MKFSVETWAPEYGIAADVDQLTESTETVTIDLERPPDRWEPIEPGGSQEPTSLMFVDGIRRIDARIWIHDGDRAHAGVCASVAAGSVV